MNPEVDVGGVAAPRGVRRPLWSAHTSPSAQFRRRGKTVYQLLAEERRELVDVLVLEESCLRDRQAVAKWVFETT